MKPKAIAVFVVVVLGVSGPGAYRQRSNAHSRHERTAQAQGIAEIADPADVSPTAGPEESVGSYVYTIASAIAAVFIAGFWIYCLVRAVMAAGNCLRTCITRPWFLKPKPALRRIVPYVLILCAWQAKAIQANDIYFDYSVSTDGDLYNVGDEVSWSISAGIEGDTRGIGGFDIDLYESMNEELNGPVFDYIISFEDMQFHPTYLPISYMTTGQGLLDFNFKNGFDAFNASGGAGLVSGIGVSQFDKVLDQTGGTVCEGYYTVTRVGFHYLAPVHNSGYVWIDGQDDAEEVLDWDRTGSAIYVTSNPEATLGSVDMAILSNIVSDTDEDYCNAENAFCDGSDVNEDGEVNNIDVYEVLVSGESNIDIFSDTYDYHDIIVPGDPEQPLVFNSSGSQSSDYVRLGNDTVFSATDDEYGEELWRINSKTYEDSTLDINPGSASSSPQLFTRLEEEVYFIAKDNDEAWSIYSLPKGEDEVILIQDNIHTGSNTDIVSLTSFQESLYYTINTEEDLRELWSFDSTTGEIDKVIDLGASVPTGKSFIVHNNYMFIPAFEEEYGFTVSRFDGEYIERIAILGTEWPVNFTKTDNFIYFKTKNNSTFDNAIWIINPDTGFTNKVLSGSAILMMSDEIEFASVNDSIFYVQLVIGLKTKLMKYDPFAESFREIKSFKLDNNPSIPYREYAVGEDVYVSVLNFTLRASELWKYNETEGFRLLKRFSSAGSNYTLLTDYTDMADILYFLESEDLYMADGSNVSKVRDVEDLSIKSLKRSSDKLIFTVDSGDRGEALWIYGPNIK